MSNREIRRPIKSALRWFGLRFHKQKQKTLRATQSKKATKHTDIDDVMNEKCTLVRITELPSDSYSENR